MKKLHKKILIILSIVLALGIFAALPGFAETQEELKKIFVTRDEFNEWINGKTDAVGNTIETGISEVLKDLEIVMQQSVQSKVKVEMSKRNIKESSSSE